MKVILDYDRIINISDIGTEIGTPPSGVDITRLRWDGYNIIDLNDLSQIWVEYKNGVFILHAIEVPDSQLVTMTYADRKYLTLEGPTIRLKTSDERYIDSQLTTKERATARFYSRIQIPPLFFRFIFELVYIIAKGLREEGASYLAFLDQFITDVEGFADDATLLANLPDQVKKFAELTQLFYSHASSSSCSSSRSSSSSSKSSSCSSSSSYSATPDYFVGIGIDDIWSDTDDDWWLKSSSSSSISSSSSSFSISSSSSSSISSSSSSRSSSSSSCSCSSSSSSKSSSCSSSSSRSSSSSSKSSSCSSSSSRSSSSSSSCSCSSSHSSSSSSRSSSCSSSSSSLSSSCSCSSSSSSRSSSSSSRSSSCSSSSSRSSSSSSRSSSSSSRSSSCSSSSSAWIFVPL